MNIFVPSDGVGEPVLHSLRFEPLPAVFVIAGTLVIIDPWN